MNEKKILKFDLQSKDLQVKNLLNQEFLNISIKAISSANPNRNRSHFTPDSLRKATSTCYNKPILAHFKPEENDFGAHEDNGLHYDSENDNYYFDYTKDSEVPIGLIRQNDKVEVVEENGLTWLNVSAALWVQYNYKACKRLLKDRHKKVSVEVEVNSSYIDERGIEIIEDFTLLGISVLGSSVTEAIPGASLDITDLKDNAMFNKQFARLQFAYQKLDEQTETKDTAINNTFSTVHNSNPEPNSTSGPDFEQPVENEKDKEITMKTEKGGENVEEFEIKLTNDNKADLLSSAIREALPDNGDPSSFAYLADFDDEFLYYCLNGAYYKAPYSIDTSTTPYAVNIALDEAIPVIRSWGSYSDTKNSDMDEKDMKKMEEECPECHKPMSECECDKKQNEACDDKQVEACEDKQVEEKIDVTVHSAEEGDKEECSTENKEECSEGEDCEKECNNAKDVECNSTEDKEECASDEKPEEKECNSVDPEDGTHVNHSADDGECEKECNSAEEKECNNAKDVECNSEDGECPEKECNSEDGKEECSAEEKECNSAENVECNSTEDKQCEETIISPDTYSVDGEMISGAQLFEKFTALQTAYNQLQEKFSSKMQEEFRSFAYVMVKDEVDLSEDNAKAIFSQIDEACSSKKFSSQDEVEDYTTSLIAKALYSQKKEARKSAKEYSSNIVKNQNTFSGSNNSDVDELKSVNDKLKNL